VALLVSRSPEPLVRLPLVTDALDLAASPLLIYFTGYFTGGPASPVFPYVECSLLCAILRWRWRGTLGTAVAAPAAFIGMDGDAVAVVRDPDFEPNTFVGQSEFLAVGEGF
jgi:hypothetical protein